MLHLFEAGHEQQTLDDEAQLEQYLWCDDHILMIELLLHFSNVKYEKQCLKIKFKQMQKFFNSTTKQRKIMFNKKHRDGAFVYSQYFDFVLL